MKTVNEEGLYLIKRVKKLPVRGNYNWLYAIIDEKIDKLYRWTPKRKYEAITIGSAADVFDAVDLSFNSETKTLSSTFTNGEIKTTSFSDLFSQTDFNFNTNTNNLNIKFTDGSIGTVSLDSLVASNNNLILSPIYISMEEAISYLGNGKIFRYNKQNLDGVSSPNNSTIGIT